MGILSRPHYLFKKSILLSPTRSLAIRMPFMAKALLVQIFRGKAFIIIKTAGHLGLFLFPRPTSS